jgi:hypothetical protein
MDSFVLEDWVTVQGATGVTVTQGEGGWLDLEAFEDVVFWLLVNNASPTGAGAPTLLYQTAPTKDEAFFATQTAGMTGTPVTLVSAAGTAVVTPVLAWNAPFPLARWVRWQIPAVSAPFTVTMRIVVAATAPRQ